MLLKADALATHLSSAISKNALAPLYVVAGHEALLQMEACDAIRHAARKAGYSEREVHSVSPKFDWDHFAAASGSLSLFADKKIIELRIPTGKPGKEGSAMLQQMAQSPVRDDSTVLLITLPQPDRDMKAAKWFAPLQEAAIFVTLDTIERPALPAWIQARLRRQQQTAPREALQFIADRVEGNLLAAHQEIQKLGLLYPTRELTLEEVQDAVLNVARYDVFKLSEALLAADAARYARMLYGLQAEGEALPLVLWTMAEELRTLWRVKCATESGQAMSSILRELRVWGARERLLPGMVQRLSRAQLAEAIRRCAALDKAAKGLPQAAQRESMTGEPWADLLALGLSLMPLR